MDTGQYYLKNDSKKVVHKAGEVLESKTADAVTKAKGDKTVKQERVEKIIIPPEEIDKILNKLRQALL